MRSVRVQYCICKWASASLCHGRRGFFVGYIASRPLPFPHRGSRVSCVWGVLTNRHVVASYFSIVRRLGGCGATWRNLEITYDVSGPCAPLSIASANFRDNRPALAAAGARPRKNSPDVFPSIYSALYTVQDVYPCPYDTTALGYP
jgi:hypothetical protein